jgi:2-polyprenyl-3-methyl-5-hydroxy-6-metoxy-1,4-benzoquinol methylase
MGGFDDAFRRADVHFGGQPEPILVEHPALLNADLPALDIGCGQGRNALFLDREGFVVDALDPSAVAIGQVSRTAEQHDLGPQHRHGSGAVERHGITEAILRR